MVREDQVDILVELTGHTARTDGFSKSPLKQPTCLQNE